MRFYDQSRAVRPRDRECLYFARTSASRESGLSVMNITEVDPGPDFEFFLSLQTRQL